MECPICLGSTLEPVSLSCGHFFCGTCLVRVMITQWAQPNASCPMCRSPVFIAGMSAESMAQSYPQRNLAPVARSPSPLPIGIEASDDDTYEVSDILDGRRVHGRYEYLVLWSSGEQTWEPLANLAGVAELLRRYRQRRHARIQADYRRRRARRGRRSSRSGGSRRDPRRASQ